MDLHTAAPSTPTTTATTAPTLDDYARHSPWSDPGAHAPLVAALPPDPQSLHEAVTSVVLHYRAGATPPTPDQLADVDRRRVAATLDAAVARAPGPLVAPRAPDAQVGGCCRDHSLLAVAILREHQIPARTRVGFADYLGEPGFHHDHVVVERHDGGRWVRSDPELVGAEHAFDVHDVPTGEGAPFRTAAEVWLDHRAGRTDLADHGAGPDVAWLTGPGFVQRYVLADLAHRQRAELLLWDVWGAMTPPGGEPDAAALALADHVAALTVRADRGDEDSAAADDELAALWATDERVRPARYVSTWSPARGIGWTDLVAGTTAWSVVPAEHMVSGP